MSPECEHKIIDLLQLLHSRVARLEEAVSQTGVGRNTVEPDLQLAPRDCVASLAENTHPSALEDVSSGTRMCLHGHSVSGQGQTPASQIRLAAGDNAVDTTGPGGPIAESAAATTRRSKKQSMQQQMLAVTIKETQTMLDEGDDDIIAAKTMSEFLEHERDMWAHVKSTQFHECLLDNKIHGTCLPLRHWLRLQLQFDTSLTVTEVLRIFHEEDSMLAMSLMILPWKEANNQSYLYLLFFSVMHPVSAMRTRWDVYILLVMLALCLITPYTIGFDITPDNTSIIGVWEKIVDASFVLDILFNFRTAFTSDQPPNFVVSSLKLVAVRYLKGFFVIDFLSTVPWDVVLANDGLGIFELVKLSKLMKLLRMARALKLVRILRLIKAPMVLKQLENNMGRAHVHILSLACVVIVLLHLFACLFHYVTLWGESTTWLEASGIVNTSSLMDRYLSSLYWAMSTMATVGYGDITPILMSEKVVAMAGMLCGVTVFAYVTSTVSSLLTTFNTQSMRTQQQQRNIDAFCRSHRLPKPLARKLSGFYDYVLPRDIHREDENIICGLPDTLQQQVILTINAPLFDKLPIFKSIHPQILQHLIPKLGLEYHLANEYVIWQGDRAIRMFFIGDGIIEVRRLTETDAPARAKHDAKLPPAGTAAVLMRQGTRKRADDLWKCTTSNTYELPQSAIVHRRTHTGVVTSGAGTMVARRASSMHENSVRKAAANWMLECAKMFPSMRKRSSIVHPQLQRGDSNISDKSALPSGVGSLAAHRNLKCSDKGARDTRVSFVRAPSGEGDSAGDSIFGPSPSFQQQSSGSSFGEFQQQLSDDSASVVEKKPSVDNVGAVEVDFQGQQFRDSPLAVQQQQSVGTSTLATAVKVDLQRRPSGDSGSVVLQKPSDEDVVTVNVDLQQQLPGSSSATVNVETLHDILAVTVSQPLDADAQKALDTEGTVVTTTECPTEVAQNRSAGDTAVVQLKSGQNKLVIDQAQVDTSEGDQDCDRNTLDLAKVSLLTDEARVHAQSDGGSFDIAPVAGSVFVHDQRFEQQNILMPAHIRVQDDPHASDDVTEAKPVAECTLGNTVETHVGQGGEDATRRATSAAQSTTYADQSEADLMEAELMERMIGISTASFKRLGRLKRGAHFGERDCLHGTRPAVSMVTVTACELYSLTKEHLVKLIADWQELAVVLRLSRTTLEECGHNQGSDEAQLAAQLGLAGVLDDTDPIPVVSIGAVHKDKQASSLDSDAQTWDTPADLQRCLSVDRIAKEAAHNRLAAARP